MHFLFIFPPETHNHQFESLTLRQWGKAEAKPRLPTGKQREHMGQEERTDRSSRNPDVFWGISIIRTNCWKEINGKKEEGCIYLFHRGDLPRTYLWMSLNLQISDSDDSWMIKKRRNKMDLKKLGDCSLECYLQHTGIFPWWTGLPIKIVGVLLSNHMIM